ncbi:MAG: sulfatase [Saprospiraceae bacterium]|nr:sulfatase [Saprospiraceae bacterium]
MRNSFAVLLILLVIAGSVLMSLLLPNHSIEEKPNIIFLLTDDQRWDALGAMGNSEIMTPNLDRLAQEGVMFRNAYVTTPICCTSRASILSGQYARRHKINDFQTHFSRKAWKKCYPHLMKMAGYYSGFVGKYGVGSEKDFPLADFDYWKGIPGQPYYETEDDEGHEIHLTRKMGDQCLDFIRQAPDDQPFCLSVSFKAPHVQDGDLRQFIFDPAYQDLFRNTVIPPVKHGEDAVYEKFPEFFRENNEARNRWQIRFATPDMYQESVKAYYRLIYGVDVVVGKIRKALEEQGLDKNTIIVFMGDNGFFLGEKGLAGKWFAYEESIRVPLLIYDPFLAPEKRGQIRDEIALNIDIAPTILNFAGIKVPNKMQGRPLSATYTGQSDTWRSEFLFEHEFKHPGLPKSEGIISTTEKYFRYLPPAPPYEEMYDLIKDPDEMNNLATQSEFNERKNAMRSRLEKLIDKSE